MRNRIDIAVNNARLESFSVCSLSNKKIPDIGATLGLYAGEKKISEFRITTNSWDDNKFIAPIKLHESIVKIAIELEVIATQLCNSEMAQLPAPKEG